VHKLCQIEDANRVAEGSASRVAAGYRVGRAGRVGKGQSGRIGRIG
jgi:hypothetical protein